MRGISQTAYVRAAVLAALATATITTFACGSGNDDSSPEHLEEVRETLRQHTTPEQFVYLEDGVVTFEEYEAAMLTTVRCVEEAGFSATISQEGTLLRVRGGAVSSLSESRRWGEVYNKCWEQYSDDVEALWQAQNAPSEAERREQEGRVLECVRDANIEVDDYQDLAQMLADQVLNVEQNHAVLLCQSKEFGALSTTEDE